MTPSRVRRHPARLLALGLLLALGCAPATGALAGKVTFHGKPVVTGSVLVQAANGVQRVGAIEPDGSFLVAEIPCGPVTIAVLSPEPPGKSATPARTGRGGDPGTAPTDRAAWIKLPDHLADPRTSKLAGTVQPGPNAMNLELP